MEEQSLSILVRALAHQGQYSAASEELQNSSVSVSTFGFIY